MSKLTAANIAICALFAALERESTQRQVNQQPVTQGVVDSAAERVTALKCKYLDADPGVIEELDLAVANLRQAYIVS